MSNSTGAKAAPALWSTFSGLLSSWRCCNAPAMSEEEFIVSENVTPGSNKTETNNPNEVCIDEVLKGIRPDRLGQELLVSESTSPISKTTNSSKSCEAALVSENTVEKDPALGVEGTDADEEEATVLARVEELFDAIWTGRYHEVPPLLDERTINAMHEQHGLCPIHACVVAGSEALFWALFDFGADVNKKDRNGYTPLQLAAKNNASLMIVLLLESGADPASLAAMKLFEQEQVWTKLSLWKFVCGSSSVGYFHYALSFGDVMVDFGRGKRGGTSVPGTGLEIYLVEELGESPAVVVDLGTVPLSTGELLSVAVFHGLDGDWTTRDYSFATRNCQDWAVCFAKIFSLKVEGDEYLKSKRAIQAWLDTARSMFE